MFSDPVAKNVLKPDKGRSKIVMLVDDDVVVLSASFIPSNIEICFISIETKAVTDLTIRLIGSGQEKSVSIFFLISVVDFVFWLKTDKLSKMSEF